ncbi:MAG: glycerol-3-phosphate 1-O-acyltransferase PlsY [Planctomycetota bacterium]|nr:glycerol-3-phosphate 1-O-acyltransferase PlsY [Planctomycetota bacterium]
MTFPLAMILGSGLAGALVASYLLGAVPFGLVMAKMFKGIDLRTVGSGNIGATNAMRAMGKPLGLTAFLLDWGKGFVAAYFFAPWGGSEDQLTVQVLCGALAVIGHCFPVYLKFKGGKGVATASGAIIAMDPIVFLAGGVVWLVVLFTSRYVSVASILMGITFPVAAYVRMGSPGLPFILGCAALATLILVRHRENMKRLMAGTESKIGQGKLDLANNTSEKGDHDRG